MKKVVVVGYDDNSNKAVAMCSNGTFCDIKVKQKVNVGDVIYYRLNPFILFAFFSCIIACAIAILSGVVGVVSYVKSPITYFSIDINPSVEFMLNKNGKVVSAHGMNEDGNILIANQKFVGLNASEATKKTVDLATQSGYIDISCGSEVESMLCDENMPTVLEKTNVDKLPILNAVMITVISDKQESIEKVQQEAIESANNYFDNFGIFSFVLTETGDAKLREEARKNGLSVGKMKLINNVKSFEAMDVMQLKKMPIKELNHVIAEKHKNEARNMNPSKYIYSYKMLCRDYYPVYNEYVTNLTHEKLEEFKASKAMYVEKSSEVVNKISDEWLQYKGNWMEATHKRLFDRP